MGKKEKQENNFLDVKCPKCGQRNVIEPPHKCIDFSEKQEPIVWESEFDSAFDWIESEKERCELMYGFTAEKLKQFIRETLSSSQDTWKRELASKIAEMKGNFNHEDKSDWGDYYKGVRDGAEELADDILKIIS